MRVILPPRLTRRSAAVATTLMLLLVVGVTAGWPGPERSEAAAGFSIPRPAHTVVVMMENEDRVGLIGDKSAPYLTSLAARGANMTRSYGVTHPSQPNYIALLSGSRHSVTSNGCPKDFPTADNLGHQLLSRGLSFSGYADALPAAGYTGCVSGTYQLRKPARVSQPALLGVSYHAGRFRSAPRRLLRQPRHVPRHA